jgi:hypothetical protein
LKLKCVILLSTSAFKFNLRRFVKEGTLLDLEARARGTTVGRCIFNPKSTDRTSFSA